MQLLATVIGGTPGRLIAAYCEKGPLDQNLQKACRDLGAYYGMAAVVCTAAGALFPPALIFAPFCAAGAALFAIIGAGQAPTGAQVQAIQGAAQSAQSAVGSPTAPPATDLAGQIAAVWGALDASGAVPHGKNEPSNSVGSSSSCAKLEDNLKHQAARAAAIAAAKAASKAKLAACVATGGHYEGGKCVNPAKDAAIAAAKASSAAKLAACQAQGGHYDATKGACVLPGTSSSAPPPDTAKKTNPLVYLALAAAGAKALTVLL